MISLQETLHYGLQSIERTPQFERPGSYSPSSLYFASPIRFDCATVNVQDDGGSAPQVSDTPEAVCLREQQRQAFFVSRFFLFFLAIEPERRTYQHGGDFLTCFTYCGIQYWLQGQSSGGLDHTQEPGFLVVLVSESPKDSLDFEAWENGIRVSLSLEDNDHQ